MVKTRKEEIFRIVDANYNRAKEGLRVCEDVHRFVFDNKSLTNKYKQARHQLTDIVASLPLKKIIQTRSIETDVGRRSTHVEFQRRNTKDILYANSQRVKESLRVLEEFGKLINGRSAQRLKKLRYEIYALEKKGLNS